MTERDVLRRLLNALDAADSNRGVFSCVSLHDVRCPKDRAENPDMWKGEWRCECGREELEEAIQAAIKVLA